jgi:hypothetical protein
MNWFLVGRALRLGFFLRVPLLTLLLLAAIGPVSQFTAAKSLFGNLFDQQNDAGAIWYNAFVVSFSAFLLAFTAITAINLVLHYGALRFSDDPDSPQCFDVSQKRPGLTFMLGTLPAVVLVATVIARTGLEHWRLTLSAAVLAFLSALAMALLAKIVQLALTNADVTPHPPPFLIFPVYRLPFLEKRLDDLYCWPSPGSRSPVAFFVRRVKFGFGGFSQWPYQIFEAAGQGYFSTIVTPQGRRLKLSSGHVFALTLALLALATYVIVGYNKSYITSTPASVPALAYVLLFLIVACWFLSALTFFVDRYRFPLLASLIVLASITASVPQSDYYFRVETSRTVKKLAGFDPNRFRTPATYLSERAKDAGHRRLILVATPGGGIQAAAWTAEVLERLDRMFPDRKGANGFRKSVALISSVSGGSLGSMIYAASFAGNVDPNCVAENARASAIDEVAWGLTSPDFWRVLIPLFRPHPEIDRGWALEQKWAVINGLSPEPACEVCRVREKPACVGHNPGTSPVPAEEDTYLSDWAARGTEIPALILNSTLVERGQHVVFSTTRFPGPKDPRGIVNFYDLYPHVGVPFDIRVNTAARLSASFPFVAPASRPNLHTPYVGDFHFVDGGYYDNLGVDALIGWLASAYRGDPALRRDFPEVLVLQIRHFNPKAQAFGRRAGWSFQLFAPLAALLNMWNTAPVNRDRNELDLFSEDSALMPNSVTIKTATVPYCGLDYSRPADNAKAFEACIASAGGRPVQVNPKPFVTALAASQSKRKAIDCAEPPLSWKLTADQKVCIDETWRAFARDDPNGALATVRNFLYGSRTAR